jgi:hypothetical protein
MHRNARHVTRVIKLGRSCLLTSYVKNPGHARHECFVRRQSFIGGGQIASGIGISRNEPYWSLLTANQILSERLRQRPWCRHLFLMESLEFGEHALGLSVSLSLAYTGGTGC